MLTLTSTLQELPLNNDQIDLSHSSLQVAQILEQQTLLPGLLLYDRGRFVGMISRQRLFEHLMRSHAMELFWHRPISLLYSYIRADLLILSENTSILTAAQQAFHRSRELLGEPIVVRSQETYQLLDIHELNIAYWQIRGIETQVRYERAQARMIQSDKMANLGRLVDGIAHEMLDPVSFVWGNLSFVTLYTKNLLQLFRAYKDYLGNALPADILAFQEEIDLDFLEGDLARSLESIKVGADRLTKLATSLQNFCHIDDVYPKPADLHQCLDNILLLLKSRLTTEIQVVKHYGHLPPVPCFVGLLSQVFMNIACNSVDALLSQAVHQQLIPNFQTLKSPMFLAGEVSKPCLEITTKVCPLPHDQSPVLDQAPDTTQSNTSPDTNHVHQLADRWVSVCIANNGPGLSLEAQQRVLKSFSIEQRTSAGTGLAISYQIVTAKHGGQFKLRSQPGVGTEFEILLPLL